MSRTGRGVLPSWTVARGVLLAAVMAGLFGMHVLTADDGTGGHGALPVITAAGPDQAAPAAGSGILVTPPPADPGSGGDHGAMAGCLLFLVAGGSALIITMLLQRPTVSSPSRGALAAALTDFRRRGPPSRRPRLALCVIRV